MQIDLVWLQCIVYFEGSCAYCGKTPRFGDSLIPFKLTINGTVTVPTCDKCAKLKGTAEWREWYMAQEMFSQDRMNRIFKWRNMLNNITSEVNQ